MPPRKVAPYSALAAIYDYVMDHVDYGRWARYLLALLDKHGVQVQQVLDVSCGTGSLGRCLQEAGLRVYGCDAAVSMLQAARKKMASPFIWCSDIRHLALRFQPQAILSTYDSMNYLMTEADWLAALRSVQQLLSLNGIFIFDISTLHNSKTLFQRYLQREATPAGNYVRTSYYQKRNSIQINEFKIRLTGAPSVRYHEVHRQKILSLATVLGYIAQTDMTVQGCYADFTFLPAREEAERLHFVLKKG